MVPSFAKFSSRRSSFARPLAAGALLFWLALPALADFKVYYLRHGEGGHNVVGEWQDKPKETWPAYVGNADMFTPKGEQQVAAVAGKLKDIRFDFIAVSPTWRTRHTILPYLQATGQRAEIWPELIELPGGESAPKLGALPAPSADLFAGKKVEIPKDEEAFFTLRPDGDRRMKFGEEPAQREADRAAVAARTVELLRERLGKGDKTILLVGHGFAGRYVASTLTGAAQEDLPSIKNTGLWMAEKSPDGVFKIVLFNDAPFDEAKQTERSAKEQSGH